MFSLLKKLFGSAHDRLLGRYRKIVDEVNVWDDKFESLSDDEVKAKTEEFKARFQAGESLDDLLPEAYAIVKQACRRLIGTEIHVSGYDQKWDMVPYDVQLVGAIAMHKGAIAEMQTGEGKTLTASLPLYLNALTGRPVHLVTVNDYLAARDCEWIGTVLRWLGLTTGSLTNETPIETRKELYACDVVYGTASEFGFDYLRDNSMAMHKDQQVQRGYYYAIIDEVDSVLVDEARTPLIISGPSSESNQMYEVLKGSVSELIKKQRDLCNKMATEAVRKLEKRESLSAEEIEQQLRQIWIVSKGMPRHKLVKRFVEDPDQRAELDEIDLYYHGEQGKKEKYDVLAELYVIIDERASEYELTDKGIHTWGDLGKETSIEDFEMYDLGHEFHKIDSDNTLDDETKANKRVEIQDLDAKRKEKTHNVRQLLRAHLLMEKDVDYIVQGGKVIIIDEHTGRPQPGRRFSDGLHQSIEAKERVEIQKETQTYATVTLQNYFRMYDKLSGMTGTALTEAGEFKEIYELDVLDIPTHRPCVRADENDEIYMTEREKYNAILKEVKEIHGQGRPILMGTESVEVSEKLARILKQNKFDHIVLNAKHHGQEAEIIAKAGQRGAITIATNMAGRGTDIKLGKGIADLGGLHVLGTTRHQSRRIDRQLRGRCARQGDPGTSKFFISFEDSLMRLFASPRLNSMLQRFRPPEGEPISAGILNKSIETAQKRVEQRNYAIRKHTLEYDDVMNLQRQEIYAFRGEILTSNNIEEQARDILESVCVSVTEEYTGEAYRQRLSELFPIPFPDELFESNSSVEQVETVVIETVLAAFKSKCERERQKVGPAAGQGEHPMESAVRNIMLGELDHQWQGHLLMMDHLRSDVMMRSVGQRDPLMEFKHEAFALFDDLSMSLRSAVASKLFKFEMVPYDPAELERILGKITLETDRSLLDEQPSKG